jgi:hypothetical protein
LGGRTSDRRPGLHDAAVCSSCFVGFIVVLSDRRVHDDDGGGVAGEACGCIVCFFGGCDVDSIVVAVVVGLADTLLDLTGEILVGTEGLRGGSMAMDRWDSSWSVADWCG